MSSGGGELALLDTNVLVHLARGDSTGLEIERRHSLSSRAERPLLSSIVEGETLALAHDWGWGEEKMKTLRQLLDQLVRIDAGEPEIVEAYVELYCVAKSTGQSMGQDSGQNDLWIAATAMAAGAAIYTCDHDFDWLHPKYLTVYYIPESA
ncbi:MAG: PIN domain-containing protein [Armatimonadetes bacterium]|nr:PIN domain-containing protein [Armatimonadota bacterium]